MLFNKKVYEQFRQDAQCKPDHNRIQEEQLTLRQWLMQDSQLKYHYFWIGKKKSLFKGNLDML